MKNFKIDLKKIASGSKQAKGFSDALMDAKNCKEEKRGFTKTFVASGKNGELVPR